MGEHTYDDPDRIIFDRQNDAVGSKTASQQWLDDFTKLGWRMEAC
jgi:hypothetical protein